MKSRYLIAAAFVLLVLVVTALFIPGFLRYERLDMPAAREPMRLDRFTGHMQAFMTPSDPGARGRWVDVGDYGVK